MKKNLLVALAMLICCAVAQAEDTPQTNEISQTNQVSQSGGVHQLIRVSLAGNALSWDCFQSNFAISDEVNFHPMWGVGAQIGAGIGNKAKNQWKLDTDIMAFKTQVNIDVYALCTPLKMENHRLSIGLGYSLGFYGSTKLTPTEPSAIGRMQIDHGVLARVAYDHIWNNGMSLGVFCQYTNYLKHKDTQDLLNIGITAGWHF